MKDVFKIVAAIVFGSVFMALAAWCAWAMAEVIFTPCFVEVWDYISWAVIFVTILLMGVAVASTPFFWCEIIDDIRD